MHYFTFKSWYSWTETGWKVCQYNLCNSFSQEIWKTRGKQFPFQFSLKTMRPKSILPQRSRPKGHSHHDKCSPENSVYQTVGWMYATLQGNKSVPSSNSANKMLICLKWFLNFFCSTLFITLQKVIPPFTRLSNSMNAFWIIHNTRNVGQCPTWWLPCRT